MHLFNITFFNKTIPICLHFNSISPILCPYHCVFVKSLLILASVNSQQHSKKLNLQKTAYSVPFFVYSEQETHFSWCVLKRILFVASTCLKRQKNKAAVRQSQRGQWKPMTGQLSYQESCRSLCGITVDWLQKLFKHMDGAFFTSWESIHYSTIGYFA